MKKFFTFVILALVAVSVWGDPILIENFKYNLGELKGQGDWVVKGTQTANPIQVIKSPLTYAGYMDKAIGCAAQIEDKTTSDEDLYKTFPNSTKITSGTAYMSALFKVTKNVVTENPTYFLAMTKGTTGEYCKLFVLKGSTETTYKIGITKTVTTANKVVYYSEELTVGTTYLCVLGYTWVDGTTNDIASLWINPATNLKTQPTADAQESSSSDATELNGFELQQRCTYNSTCPVAIVDGIRVATNWADLFVQIPDEDTPSSDPTISTTPQSSITFEAFKPSETNKKTITVTAANLTEGISITKTTDAITLSKTSITLEELAAGSVDVDVTIATTQETSFEDVITFTSGETTKEVNVTATVWEPTKEDVLSFEALLKKSSTKDVIYTYKGTSAKIMTVDEAGKQIVLTDNSEKTATVLLTDAQWDEINPVAGMKVKTFVFTAELITSITVRAICTPITLEFKDADFTREVTSLDYGTICVKGVVNPSVLANIDATFYKILYKEGDPEAPTNIVFEEVTELEDCVPYIFKPNSTGTMKFYVTQGSYLEARDQNGLIGTFEKMDITPGMYLIYNNMVCKAGTGCDLAANRAYINISQVPTKEEGEPKAAPGMNRVSLVNPNGIPGSTTGCKTLNAKANYRKVMMGGNLVIINNDKKINVLGQTVK